FFTTKPAGRGTGLGLSVIRGIIQEHSGAIEVSSALGEGASFVVTLPANAGCEREEELVHEPRRGSGRVLFLDDEELLVTVGVALLERLGYSVSGFTRAADALASIEEDPRRFDFVITDLNMPEVSGVEFARAVAELAPGVPVILASGRGDRVLSAAGVRHWIRKPYNAQSLAQALARAGADARSLSLGAGASTVDIP
ncbi:MAG: response regulator, partial [Myxococcales bacterium]|nr:response regulator [Myxococcales bacterium]